VKIFYYDVETCGLNPRQHSIHQLSAIIEVDGKVVETLDFKIAPHPKSKIDAAALGVCGVTEEQIRAYPSPEAQFRRLKAVLAKYVNPYDKTDKFYRCGFNNAAFDNEFLRVFFDLNGDNSHFMYFRPESLDVMILAAHYLAPVRDTMPSFKLHRVAKTLGIDVDKDRLHDAIYDVELTREIYKRLALPQIETINELD
jgi:DNA polymerase III subunit epsilon